MNIIDVGLRFNGLRQNNNSPKSIVVHHIEANNWTVERLNVLHRDDFGWAGIGYHFYIRKDGSVYRGRPESTQGAHVAEFNYNSLGVAFEGDYHKVDKEMPQAQFNTWVELKDYLFNKYGAMNIYGHKEVGSSSCPGQYFPLDKIKNGELKANVFESNKLSGGFRDMNINYKNGSTREQCYADQSLSLNIGSLDPWESCTQIGVNNGRPIILYNTSSGQKVAFVEYNPNKTY